MNDPKLEALKNRIRAKFGDNMMGMNPSDMENMDQFSDETPIEEDVSASSGDIGYDVTKDEKGNRAYKFWQRKKNG